MRDWKAELEAAEETIELYHLGLEMVEEIRVLRQDKHLYEVNDEVTIWETPEGPKTSVKTKIVRGFRLL